MRIEAYNTDCLDCDYTRVIILDYENVIITAPKIFPDGRIQDDEIDNYADEDYQLLIPFVYKDEDNETDKNHEEPIHMMIHIGEDCEEGYIMKIDYATKTVEISRNEKYQIKRG